LAWMRQRRRRSRRMGFGSPCRRPTAQLWRPPCAGS
jgi:hypothetical protein